MKQYTLAPYHVTPAVEGGDIINKTTGEQKQNKETVDMSAMKTVQKTEVNSAALSEMYKIDYCIFSDTNKEPHCPSW